MIKFLVSLSIIFIISGCSTTGNNIENVIIDPEQKYQEIIDTARKLHSEGNTDKAITMLDDVKIKSEDVGFYSELLSKTNESSLSIPLEIVSKSSKKDGDYMYTNGSVKNNGTESYAYVKVKVTYLDADNNVIDTDWTYVVDSVAIKPNESKKFELMTKYIDGMKNYRLELLQ